MTLAAALLVPVFAAWPAQAGCTPIHDPGSGCANYKFNIGLPRVLDGADARVKGTYISRTLTVKSPDSFVADTADDGLDVYLWVQYSVRGTGELVSEPIAVASGAGVTTPVDWISREGVSPLRMRACLGPGEAKCSMWFD